MSAFAKSMAAYEAWLKRHLRDELVGTDLSYKHKKMRKSPFAFLRATYWRWAETILDVCPDLRDDPTALCVGDIHLENFGVWRDIDDRLVWGVNDFDEAAIMPFSLDLVRLAASALLLKQNEMSAGKICAAIEKGYRGGVAAPRAIVLERDHAPLRNWIMDGEPKREAFWKKLEHLKKEVPAERFVRALHGAMPGRVADVRTARLKRKGLGSLGRPRWVALGDWRGGPVAREAKAILPSAWNRHHAPRDTTVRWTEIAEGPYRSGDPWLQVVDCVVVRRLAPHCRKIEMKEEVKRQPVDALLKAMGRDLANLHAGTPGATERIKAALRKRDRSWLRKMAKDAAASVADEWRRYR